MPAASVIMNRAASLLNDTPRTLYSYAVQVPYLNMALHELMEELERHDIATTFRRTSVVPVAAGATTIALPADLVEVEMLEERNSGTLATDFREMSKVANLPDITSTANFGYWDWNNGAVRFNAATGDKDIRITYIGRIQADVVDENTLITIPNCESYLWFRTGALLAEYVGGNMERAASLNANAGPALDRMMGTKIKQNQDQPVRRRPFMFGRKMNG